MSEHGHQTTAERARLADSPDLAAPWRRWGPYLSGRQWGTVREDYSASGDAWASFPFEHARSRAYRWGEDGIAGICDQHGFLNLAVAMWNGADPVLKERLFGLTNAEGNHGEDVKEYWWVLDGTPTHSWMRVLYRYPQAEFPFAELRAAAAAATRDDPEPELADTGVLAEDRFFDVVVSYAKAGPDDICVEITATNHGPEPAPLHLLPQLWFRNTWSWGRDPRRPALIASTVDGWCRFAAEHNTLGRYTLHAEGTPTLLVTDNETNEVELHGAADNPTRYTKDGIDAMVVRGATDTCQAVAAGAASLPGTKGAAWYAFHGVPPGESVTVRLRLVAGDGHPDAFGPSFAETMAARAREADEFYADLGAHLDQERRTVLRRALAGLLWTKQHYRFRIREWLAGDPAQPAAPEVRCAPDARNTRWRHLDVADVISMPDEWEYPWFAAWDLAFHTVPLALVDPVFAKGQLTLLCREWLMHPNGQLPAYEWDFGDVNPPVHAWAALRVHQAEVAAGGEPDRAFLAQVFHKLLLNFSWWVNRNDADGDNLFQGGFLGMDNVGPVDRSAPLPGDWRLEQADATAWMAAYCLHLLRIALELARHERAYEDVASKFVEHFLDIAEAATRPGPAGQGIWDDTDGFCYDLVSRPLPDGTVESQPVRVRSMVGLIPLLAQAVLEPWVCAELPGFAQRLDHLLARRPELARFVTWQRLDGGARRAWLSLLDEPKLRRVLTRMLDEAEFLSPHGIRSLSAAHRDGVEIEVAGETHRMGYEPRESRTSLFGGNSNWRGPVWFPVNALLVEALRTLEGWQAGEFQVELPTGSGQRVSAGEAADELSRRLVSLFLVGADGRRPADGKRIEASDSPLWRANITFSEYFDGDTGEGLGATHQTGWTAWVACLLSRAWPEDGIRGTGR
ncbi:MGH1-like glycoside hydrolase domain-containing protein [Goodfellowiella coeruleoviolacea]|uniref:MGH1-like glycoside hydrolase domain-containing protein n=1 Tax=Goodfellowiella coeruleoviolacea TaxID=334858 RepID=UPI0020A3E344|nr:glucosidase [Goodfellowiella coeruleoviolacea]